MKKSTMVEMVEELQKIVDKAYSEIKDDKAQIIDILNNMIVEAKNGEYHDFKNKKYDCGKVQSVLYLDSIAKEAPPSIAEMVTKLSDAIKNGEYDEDADSEDKKSMLNSIMIDTSMNTKQKAKLAQMLGLVSVKKSPYGKSYF